MRFIEWFGSHIIFQNDVRTAIILDHIATDLVDMFDVLLGDDLVGGAGGIDVPAVEHYDVVRVLRSDVDVMADHQNDHLLAVGQIPQ